MTEGNNHSVGYLKYDKRYLGTSLQMAPWSSGPFPRPCSLAAWEVGRLLDASVGTTSSLNVQAGITGHFKCKEPKAPRLGEEPGLSSDDVVPIFRHQRKVPSLEWNPLPSFLMSTSLISSSPSRPMTFFGRKITLSEPLYKRKRS